MIARQRPLGQQRPLGSFKGSSGPLSLRRLRVVFAATSDAVAQTLAKAGGNKQAETKATATLVHATMMEACRKHRCLGGRCRSHSAMLSDAAAAAHPFSPRRPPELCVLWGAGVPVPPTFPFYLLFDAKWLVFRSLTWTLNGCRLVLNRNLTVQCTSRSFSLQVDAKFGLNVILLCTITGLGDC